MRHFVGFMVGFVLAACVGYAAPVVTPPIVEKATTADGGFAVPPEWRSEIMRLTENEGALLGQHALAYTLLGFVAIAMHRRLLWFGVFDQAVQVLPVFFAAHAVR